MAAILIDLIKSRGCVGAFCRQTGLLLLATEGLSIARPLSKVNWISVECGLKTLPGPRPGLIGMKLAKRKVTELVPQGSRDRCRGVLVGRHHLFMKTDWVQGLWGEMPARYFLRERATRKRGP